ncbi:MAG: hydroxyacylglutathione hydrolase [Bdellovibrionota bacterium]
MRIPTYKILPILRDNYIFVLNSEDKSNLSENYIVVDPGEPTELKKFLKNSVHDNIKLNILITHHHPDHTGGLSELTRTFDCEVWGPRVSQKRIPEIQHGLKGGDTLSLCGFHFDVLALSGHTLDHIAFFEKKQHWLFSGDVLFNYGCGRLFEGDFQLAFESLQIIKNLPPTTQVFCAHEYTLKNISFALARARKMKNEPLINLLNEQLHEVNQRRSNNLPTVPFPLDKDKIFNPFLVAKNVEEFKEIRIARDLF